VLATDFDSLVAWYRDVLGFRIVKSFGEDYHYCNLETSTGIKIGIGDAGQMRVVPLDRSRNTVVLQFQVENVEEFLAHVEQGGGAVTSGPSFDRNAGFWFGSFADPEGNPFWVVDRNCP
jgi:predicted enzyme related to lactoylglutathione lyase